jgi:chromosome segregation ATPase
MYNNLEDLPPEYEKDLNILENQITELFTLLEKKEIQLSLLKDENEELRTRIQKLQQQLNQPQQQLNPPPQKLSPPQQQLSPPQHSDQQIDTIRVPNQQISLATSPSTSVSTNKRKCPKCGAMGFAIKEVKDKSRLISYVPTRIYAKKRVCTKCRYEF